MKIFKTATIVILVLIALAAITYFFPFDEILNKIPYFSDIYNNTSVTVNSKNGKSIVKINGHNYGETPVTISSLPAGEYDVEIERIADNNSFYKSQNIRLPLIRGTEAIIDLEIGPDDLQSGYVMYYTKSSTTSNNSGFLTISSNPEKIDTYLDDEYFQATPVNAYKLNAKSYQLKAKERGYEDISLPIIVRNGYNLNINLILYPIPTTLTK